MLFFSTTGYNNLFMPVAIDYIPVGSKTYSFEINSKEMILGNIQ